MSDTIYHGSLKIIVQKLIKGKREWTPESLGFGVDSFEVDGGADRKIEVSSGIDFHISSEFEQARSYKNIILYVQAGSESHKLLELSKSDKKDFFMFFAVLVWSDEGHFIRQIEIQSSATNFAGTPIPVGKTLKAKMILNGIKLNVGVYDEKRNVMRLESI
jgi:hypothetical protein